MKLQVFRGDVIRSYDFKPMVGREDCYLEGKVEVVSTTECGYQAYKVTCTKDVWCGESQKGEDSRVGKTVLVPWRVDFSEFPGRVINLTRF